MSRLFALLALASRLVAASPVVSGCTTTISLSNAGVCEDLMSNTVTSTSTVACGSCTAVTTELTGPQPDCILGGTLAGTSTYTQYACSATDAGTTVSSVNDAGTTTAATSAASTTATSSTGQSSAGTSAATSSPTTTPAATTLTTAASSAGTSSTCTYTRPVAQIGQIKSATCTDFYLTNTQYILIVCPTGYAGCDIVARGGAGPAVACGTTTTVPEGWVTTSVCSGGIYTTSSA